MGDEEEEQREGRSRKEEDIPDSTTFDIKPISRPCWES